MLGGAVPGIGVCGSAAKAGSQAYKHAAEALGKGWAEGSVLQWAA